MKTNKLETLFENLKNEFDIEEPKMGHEDRFLSKLKGEETKLIRLKPSRFHFLKPLTTIAATLIIGLGLFMLVQHKAEASDLASVSPELSETQKFFTTAIAKELSTLNNERSPETEPIINDALKRIDQLEKEYEKLKIDLTESGDDKRVIYAMISNFQNRIDLLQNVMAQIEEVKQLKQNNNEIKTTI